MRRRVLFVLLPLLAACGDPVGWIDGTMRIDGVDQELHAELGYIASHGRITVYTKDYPNGFEIKLRYHAQPLLHQGSYDLSVNTGNDRYPVEGSVSYKANGNTYFDDVVQGTVDTAHAPTLDAPALRASLQGWSEPSGDPEVLLEIPQASVELQLETSTVELIYGLR